MAPRRGIPVSHCCSLLPHSVVLYYHTCDHFDHREMDGWGRRKYIIKYILNTIYIQSVFWKRKNEKTQSNLTRSPVLAMWMKSCKECLNRKSGVCHPTQVGMNSTPDQFLLRGFWHCGFIYLVFSWYSDHTTYIQYCAFASHDKQNNQCSF